MIPRLATQRELNEFEQTNIRLAMEWANKSRTLKRDLLTVHGITHLHQKMFNQTWKWAGTFRRHKTNIGIAWLQIPEQLKNLCDDMKYWDENSTFELQEAAVRFHHRLVSIHPLPNGNGRLSRLAADLYLEYRKQPAFVWGNATSLVDVSETRKEYLAALREADKGQYDRLLAFADNKTSMSSNGYGLYFTWFL